MYAKHLLAEVHIFNRGEMRRNFVLDRKLLEEYEVSALTEVENYRNIFEIVMLGAVDVLSSPFTQPTWVAIS